MAKANDELNTDSSVDIIVKLTNENVNILTRMEIHEIGQKTLFNSSKKKSR